MLWAMRLGIDCAWGRVAISTETLCLLADSRTVRTVDIDAIHHRSQPQQTAGEEAEHHQGHCIHPHEHASGWCSRQFWCETCRTWFTGASCPGIEVRPKRAVSKHSYW